MDSLERDRKEAGWPVEIMKSTEGGPCLCDIKARAKDMGISVRSGYSPYVGHVSISLAKGTKKQWEALLTEFGCNYL